MGHIVSPDNVFLNFIIVLFLNKVSWYFAKDKKYLSGCFRDVTFLGIYKRLKTKRKQTHVSISLVNIKTKDKF